MEQDVLGTSVCPKDFATAAAEHGRHFARYLLAARHARGRRVLDAACGGGFGSAYLATVAEEVLGLDLDEKMVAAARDTHQAENVRFEIHDLHEPVAADRPFDLITSFETLEHVRSPQTCLAHLAAALATEGVAMISVPNGDKELRAGDCKSYHQVHFTAPQFSELLQEHFGDVQPLSQVYHKGLRHYLRKVLGRRGHVAGNYRFVPGLLPQAKTWLAVCRRPSAPANVPATLVTPPQIRQEQACPQDDHDSERTEQ